MVVFKWHERIDMCGRLAYARVNCVLGETVVLNIVSVLMGWYGWNSRTAQ